MMNVFRLESKTVRAKRVQPTHFPDGETEPKDGSDLHEVTASQWLSRQGRNTSLGVPQLAQLSASSQELQGEAGGGWGERNGLPSIRQCDSSSSMRLPTPRHCPTQRPEDTPAVGHPCKLESHPGHPARPAWLRAPSSLTTVSASWGHWAQPPYPYPQLGKPS